MRGAKKGEDDGSHPGVGIRNGRGAAAAAAAAPKTTTTHFGFITKMKRTYSSNGQRSIVTQITVGFSTSCGFLWFLSLLVSGLFSLPLN